MIDDRQTEYGESIEQKVYNEHRVNYGFWIVIINTKSKNKQ